MSNSAFERLVALNRGTDILGAPPAADMAARTSLRLPPSSFADDWARRPTEPEEIGLVLVSEHVTSNAMTTASRLAYEAHPEDSDRQQRIDIYGSLIMTGILAHACVDPRNRSRLYFGRIPEDTIRVALTAGGIRRLWEAYEVFAAKESPLSEEASDEQIAEAAARIAAGEVTDPHAMRRVRRLMALVAVELPPKN